MFSSKPRPEEADIPRIGRIIVFPVKSLDGLSVEKAFLGPRGALNFDRRFRLVDSAGRVVNGKRDARIHAIRSIYDLQRGTMEISAAGHEPLTARLFHDMESDKISEWFSRYFGSDVHIEEDEAGFPDDTECPGPTFVAAKTLERVRSWMGLEGEDSAVFARRFRTNIEIEGAPAFWEDQLISASGARFYAGEVLFTGVRASARCVVPSRHPESGQLLPNFSRIFSERRRRELPSWADADLFDHTYRLCVNTRVPDLVPGALLSVGDPVKLEFDFEISI